MQIFTLDREPSSKNGGQEWSLLDECVGLRSRGHEVTLGYISHGDLLARHAAAGVRLLPLSGVELSPRRRVRSALGIGASVLRASRASSDVVVVNQYHDALFGRGVASLARTPLVCHLRITPPHEFCTQWRVGLRGVDHFIAVSGTVRDTWVEQGGLAPGTIDVVFDGIDTERFKPVADRNALRQTLGIPFDAYVVVYAGRLDHTKNIEGMLRAFAALELTPEKGRLLIAGRAVSHDSPAAAAAYVQSLRSLAEALGIAPNVHWLGPRDDVPALLASADAAALFAYLEPFGRATVEALACGTPIVAHRPGGTAEILTGEFAKLAFSLDDPRESVAILRSLIGWRNRDPDFAARARTHVLRHFSSEAMVSGVEQSLIRVIGDHARDSSMSR